MAEKDSVRGVCCCFCSGGGEEEVAAFVFNFFFAVEVFFRVARFRFVGVVDLVDSEQDET